MKAHLQKGISLYKEALQFYRSVIVAAVRRIPFFVFGFFALSGALLIGIFGGFAMGSGPQEKTIHEEMMEVRDENLKLRDLVNGYEDLSKLYYEQGNNISVVLDTDTLINDPLKVRTALKSMNDYRDMINVQYGRIIELRKSAGLHRNNEFH